MANGVRENMTARFVQRNTIQASLWKLEPSSPVGRDRVRGGSSARCGRGLALPSRRYHHAHAVLIDQDEHPTLVADEAEACPHHTEGDELSTLGDLGAEYAELVLLKFSPTDRNRVLNVEVVVRRGLSFISEFQRWNRRWAGVCISRLACNPL